jgi:hypothetical protein
MKRKQIIVAAAAVAALLVGILLLFLFGSWERTLRNPLEHYANAINRLPVDQTTRLHITVNTETITSSGTFKQNSDQLLTLYYQDGIPIQAHAEEQLHTGSQSIYITEVFQDGTLYTELDGGMFRTDTTIEAFTSERTPTVLLTAENYQAVTGTTGRNGATITFTQPNCAEDWAIPDDGVFVSAEGTAKLTKSGALTESSYTIQYSLSDMTVKKQYRVSIETPPTELPSQIQNPELYIPLSNPETLRTLEQMCGYLLQAEAIRGSYSEYIFCQAFGDERTRSIGLELKTTPHLTVTADTNVTLTNTSRVGDVTQMQQTETLEDGKYTLTVNGIQEKNPQTTGDAFYSYCKNLLVGTMILPRHITGVTLQEDGDKCYLEFTASDALAQTVRADACKTLYQNPSLLDDMASDHITQTMIGYFSYSKSTGLPLSSGIRYKGIYTISDLPYRMEFHAEQTYDIQVP